MYQISEDLNFCSIYQKSLKSGKGLIESNIGYWPKIAQEPFEEIKMFYTHINIFCLMSCLKNEILYAVDMPFLVKAYRLKFWGLVMICTYWSIFLDAAFDFLGLFLILEADLDF